MMRQTGNIPSHFLVIVPGIMGSKLRHRKTRDVVWLDFSNFPLANPLAWGNWFDRFFERLTYPNDDLEPAGIIDRIVFAPPWAKLEQYSRLLAALEQMRYRIDPQDASANDRCAYTFAYDWRQDNRISAQQLSEAIDRWRTRHPSAQVWIIAHSNGGLVSRWYIEKLGGKDYVGRLLLMGSPRDGAPKALQMLSSGVVLLRRWPSLLNIDQRTRDAVRTFPCVYQLLPFDDPFLHGTDNEPINLVSGINWLIDSQRQLLLDAQKFHQDLGMNTSVPTMCFFGRRQQTPTYGILRYAAGGTWDSIEWRNTEVGDGTVPERSAVDRLPDGVEHLPFSAVHGDIYVHPSVIEFLRWQLIDKYQHGMRADLVSERLTITFNPDQDIYTPGKPMRLRVTVSENDTGAAFSGASIRVQPWWREPLPGSLQIASQQVIRPMMLTERPDAKGTYEASLSAPNAEGYYELRAVVKAVGEPTVTLEELIAVEQANDELAA